MKTKILLKPLLFLAIPTILFSSCSKTSDTNATEVPANGVIQVSASEVYPNTATGIWGALFAVRTDVYNYFFSTVIYDGGEVSLLNSSGTGYKQVAGITLNNQIGLSSDYLNIYRYGVDTLYNSSFNNTVGLDSGANWQVFNTIDQLDFSYTDKDPLPFINKMTVIDGVTVTNSQPLNIHINSTNITNADSVYIILPTYIKTPGKAYSISTGTISFSRSDLSTNTFSFNKFLTIIAFKSKVESIGGKKYLFVKEYKLVVNVNIN